MKQPRHPADGKFIPKGTPTVPLPKPKPAREMTPRPAEDS
jgi:hypothetical protein